MIFVFPGSERNRNPLLLNNFLREDESTVLKCCSCLHSLILALGNYLILLVYAASNQCTVVDMCVTSLYVHRNEQEACERNPACPRLYVKYIEIDFVVTFEENIEKCPPPISTNSWIRACLPCNLFNKRCSVQDLDLKKSII